MEGISTCFLGTNRSQVTCIKHNKIISLFPETKRMEKQTGRQIQSSLILYVSALHQTKIQT
jgi:hypothetical protein